MNDERARRVEALFLAAAELGPDERRAWLDRELAAEPQLRAEVESLLAHDQAGADFLKHPALHAASVGGAPLHAASVGSAPLPARLGAYRICSELGRGGMGVVYLAEQDHPRRHVALKVVRPGFVSPVSLRRFEREAELLARVQHPNIAQIFEAGSAESEDGRVAFLAMELVRGETLTAYANARELGTRERLRLLASVCDAVEHAHRRGVVHRDLKPSNVLVDTSSGAPQVKVLDFGIARAMDARAVTQSLATDVGQVIGTLPYMSPEQAQGETELVGPASDVYSLGVIGYELACGRLPLDVQGKPLHEALRIVRDVEPTPISQVVPVLRGDVETLLGRALEKDSSRRYASAAALAEDLRRYLDERPILARRPSRAYVLTKFARRNRTLVAGVVGVFLALSLGIAATTRQAFVTASERDRANDAAERSRRESLRAAQEMRRAKAIARFQRDMLSRVQPDLDGREVKLAAVLDAAAASLPGELAGDGAAEGGVRKTLGESYHSLGLLDEAEHQFESAWELLLASLGAEHEETVDTQGWLATTLADLGRVDEAVPLLERACLAQSEVGDPNGVEALVLRLNLAGIYLSLDRIDEAEALARENLEARRRVFGAQNPFCGGALAVLGQIATATGRFDEAELWMREALELTRAEVGDRDPATLTQTCMLATVLLQRGRLDEAEELFRTGIDVGREVLGEEHFELLAWKHNLGALLERARRPSEAEALLREVVAIHARVLSDDHPDSAIALESLVRLLERQGCFAQALDVLNDALARLGDAEGANQSRVRELHRRADALAATAAAAAR